MPGGKRRFERIPLHQLRRLLADEKKSGDKFEKPVEPVPHSRVQEPVTRPLNNVQKNEPRPKRSINEEGTDHPIGLWMNHELLRKHQNRPPRIVLHDSAGSMQERYLAPADFAIEKGPPKSARK